MKRSRSVEGDAPVAIVGIGCRFPGGIHGPESFWRLLAEGRDAIGEIPPDRIDIEHYYDARPATPGRIMTRWGGFLERIHEFDSFFFGISPRDAQRLDPQQRLLLETTWEALEDAGEDVSELEGSRTGVFVGQWVGDFENRLFAHPEALDFPMTLGSGRYAASGRVSYVFGFRGVSLTIDVACSSSLAAVHLGVRSIREGESTLALAGGVNIILQPHIHLAYSSSRMMAPDGRCKFGDASGDGYVRSEGVGMVVLKRLDQALADGDRVYAVIRGSAVNNDGYSSGSMGRPSRIGQEELLRTAYADADVAPSQVGYVEAHGTGTRVGDPVELGALATVLAEGRPAEQRAYVGSVKTNFGHTEAAAGIAGLIKAALVLQRGAIPPSLHLRNPNPNIPWESLPFSIPTTLQPWPASLPRIAGVSAYGIGGTNAHAVLEGPPASHPVAVFPAEPRACGILPLSARSSEALRALTGQYATLLSNPEGPLLAAVCAAAAVRRTALEQRAVFVANDRASMAEALQRYAAGEASATAEGSVEERKAGKPAPRIAFVVPGQGAQWVGMGRQLMACEPVFLEALRECDSAARKYVDWSLLEELERAPGSPGYKLDRIDVIQPVLIAMAIAYAAWLRSVGITPDAVVGHSMGEVGAAYLAGVLTLEQAMRIICRRSALMRKTSGRGAMAVIDLSMSDAGKRLEGLEESVSIAVNNSPRSCVISGDPESVKQVIAGCERDGVFCRLVKVDVASHSPQMDGPSRELTAELADLVPGVASLPMYSTVAARSVAGGELDAAYWGSNMRRPVRFAETIERLLADETTIFVELGPHPLLLPAIQQTAQAHGVARFATIGCGRRDEPEQANLLAALGHLWVAGAPVGWRLVEPERGHVQLPTYPWQRERHWVRQAEVRASGDPQASRAAFEMREEHRAWLHSLRWRLAEPRPASAARQNASRPWLLVPGDPELATALADMWRKSGLTVISTPLEALESTLAGSTGVVPQGIVLLPQAGADAAFAAVTVVQACARAFARADDTHLPKLWLVTQGGQAMESHPRPVSADQGAVWGAGRVIAEEHPSFWGGMIDLDPEADATTQAGELVQELLSPDGEDQIALRGGSRYVLRLAAWEDSEQSEASMRWRSDGAYLVTGGLGALGLLVAAEMVAAGARRLVLLGRTALPPRTSWNDVPGESPVGQRIAAVRALELAGANIHLLTADVGDATELERALQSYANEAWPPIIGVIHAAGVLANKLTLDMDRAAFERALRPKLAGAQNLDRLLPNVDTFILFSSISAVLGPPGMSNYAAANAGLDALAAARRARGAHGLSIQWGSWLSTGMHAGELGERNAAELQRQGIQPLTPEQGRSLFHAVAGQSGSSITVMPVDWPTYRSARGGRDRRLFAERMSNLESDATSGGSFAARLAAADSGHVRRQMLETAVRETAARVLGISPRKLDSRRPLGTVGLDSLRAIELRNRLEALLGRSLSATLAWNYPTVEALAGFLGGQGDAAPEAAPEPATPEPVAVGLAEIEELSDEDIARQLRSGGQPS
jgi:phthiocerol/phenolphthiocerol synthesis type-I polyketide synthase B